MPKKDSKKSEGEVDAGVEVPSDGSGDEAAADFDKYTKGVHRPEAEQPSEDEPHGHPFQPDAEPILVTDGAGRGQMTKSARKDETMVKISPEEAYDDPEFNPVAAADTPGHKGGPGAPDGEGTERQVGVVKSGTDENEDALDYNWKNPDEQPKG